AISRCWFEQVVKVEWSNKRWLIKALPACICLTETVCLPVRWRRIYSVCCKRC
ncbi:uvrD-like helicase C-terminal domain protein, partial [Vibrio parahaemolyticus V-223/04]